jgi:hypothetical protein
MSRKLKVAMLLVGLVLGGVFVLWYPYESGSVPEWKLQVVDQSGNAVVGAQVNQDWLNPIDDGIFSADSRTTDASGVVLFPKRVLHNRLALGVGHSVPASRLFVCWQDQFGDFDWDGNRAHLATKLALKKGSCPYG